MNCEDVAKIGLGEPELHSVAEGKPTNFPVIGLPEHLTAKIVDRYKYKLWRKGEEAFPYTQNQRSPTPQAALQALKNLLNWDPA